LGDQVDLGTTRLSTEALEDRLSSLPSNLQSIADFVRAELPVDIHIETSSQALLVRHTPEEGVRAFAITLFPAISSEFIERYEQIHGIELSPPIRHLLMHVNGGFLRELSLCGIPLSMAAEPPLLSRSGRNPFDIATAIRAWRAGYRYESEAEVLFASRNAGWTLQYGYFLRPDGSVARYTKHDRPRESKSWPSFEVFLAEELAETRRHRPAYLADVAAGSAAANCNRSGWRGLLHRIGLRPSGRS
jgi:hypothetical protein